MDTAALSVETDKLVREAGRGMYGDLPLEERKEKLTEQVCRALVCCFLFHVVGDVGNHGLGVVVEFITGGH